MSISKIFFVVLLFLCVVQNASCMEEVDPTGSECVCIPSELWTVVFLHSFDPSEEIPNKAIALLHLINLSEVCSVWHNLTTGDGNVTAKWLEHIWDQGYDIVPDPKNPKLSLLWHDNITPLHFAAARGIKDLAVHYIGCNNELVNCLDKCSCTPLSYAVVNKDLAVIKLLLAYPNILLNLQDIYGMTPLIRTVIYKKQEAVELLLLQDKDLGLSLTCNYQHEGRTDVGTALQIAELKKYTEIGMMIKEHMRLRNHV